MSKWHPVPGLTRDLLVEGEAPGQARGAGRQENER